MKAKIGWLSICMAGGIFFSLFQVSADRRMAPGRVATETVQTVNTPEQIRSLISRMKEQAGPHSQVVDLVLNEVADAIKVDEEDLQIYTSGATNIFKYPELSDNQKASQLLSTLEHTENLQELVDAVNENENGIQVYIGDESPVKGMADCSVVTANYDLGDGIRGTIGIIGPKRMDYRKVLKTLRNLMTQLDATFKNDER